MSQREDRRSDRSRKRRKEDRGFFIVYSQSRSTALRACERTDNSYINTNQAAPHEHTNLTCSDEQQKILLFLLSDSDLWLRAGCHISIILSKCTHLNEIFFRAETTSEVSHFCYSHTIDCVSDGSEKKSTSELSAATKRSGGFWKTNLKHLNSPQLRLYDKSDDLYQQLGKRPASSTRLLLPPSDIFLPQASSFNPLFFETVWLSLTRSSRANSPGVKI